MGFASVGNWLRVRYTITGLWVSQSATAEYARHCLTLLHSERPKLCTILAFLSAVGLNLVHFHGKQLCHFYICLSFQWGQLLKKRNLLLQEQILPLKRRPLFWKGCVIRKLNKKSKKLFPLVSMADMDGESGAGYTGMWVRHCYSNRLWFRVHWFKWMCGALLA